MDRNRTVTAISPLALATISLVLAVSSIVISLWSVVADPPWEPERVVERIIEPAALTGGDYLSRDEVCHNIGRAQLMVAVGDVHWDYLERDDLLGLWDLQLQEEPRLTIFDLVGVTKEDMLRELKFGIFECAGEF